MQSGLLPHPGRRGAVAILVTVTVTPLYWGDRYGHQDHRRLHAEGVSEQKGHFAPLALLEWQRLDAIIGRIRVPRRTRILPVIQSCDWCDA
jgi:hypothetical protein